MSTDGQGIKRHRNIAENVNWLIKVHAQCTNVTDDRQTTDGRATAYAEREFTFAKNECSLLFYRDWTVSSQHISIFTALIKQGSVFSAVCDFFFFLFVPQISREPLNGFAPNSQGIRVWSLA